MAGGLPAVDDLVAAFEFIRAGALIGIVEGDGAGLQTCGQGDGLEGGAGLVAVGDAAVAPLTQSRRGHGSVVGSHGVGIGLAVLVQADGQLVLPLQLLPELLVVDLLVIVGIVASQCGHAQHLAGVDIHDDAEGAVAHIILFDGLLQVLLQIVLHGHIQGQNQGIAIRGVVVFFIGIEHFGAAVSLGGDDRAGVSREGGVVVGLQAFAAHVVRIHKAQHLGGHGAVGIVAPGVELQIDDAGELIVIDELAHLLRRLLGHLTLDGAVVILGLGGLLPDKVRVHLQEVGKPRGDEVDGHRRIIFLPRLPLFILGLDAALQIVGIDENGLHRGRGGQNVHIAVVDHAPGRGESGASGLVANGHLFILVVIGNHQLVERGHQGNEEHNAA